MKAEKFDKEKTYKGKHIGRRGWVYWWAVNDVWAFELHGDSPVPLETNELEAITNIQIV